MVVSEMCRKEDIVLASLWSLVIELSTIWFEDGVEEV